MDSFADGAHRLAAQLGRWSDGDGPLYRKLADALRRAVADGVLAAGERLPSERALAAALAVSRTTVVAAYDELRAAGLLRSRQGSGTRVSGHTRPAPTDGYAPGGSARALYQRLIDGPGDLVSLACVTTEAIPPVPDIIRETADRCLAELLAETGYHPRGLPELREAVADHYTGLGLPTSPDQIVVTTGVQQAVAFVCDLYLYRGSAALIESPSFAGCLDSLRAAGADLLTVPVDEEGADVARMRRIMRERRPDLVYLMPTYHNPTGVLMSAARRRQVAELAAEYGVPVFEDGAYTGLRAPREPPPIAAFAPPGAEVITAASVGKTAWAGLRIGWLRAPAATAERISRRKAITDLGSPLLDQAVAARLVRCWPQLAAARSALLAERMAVLEERLRERLPEWRWRRPDGGAALWVRLPDGTDARVFAQVALRHGVEVVPGSVMAPCGDHDSSFRLTFSHPVDTIAVLVDRLARAWEDLRRHGPVEDYAPRVVV